MKLVISEKETGKAYKLELNEEMEKAIIGKKVWDVLSADVFGLAGYEIKITGGSDRDGFPIKPTVEGMIRKRMLLKGGIGYNQRRRGVVRRKMVRGNVVSKDIVQINGVVVKKGEKSLEELLGSAKGAKSEEKKERK